MKRNFLRIEFLFNLGVPSISLNNSQITDYPLMSWMSINNHIRVSASRESTDLAFRLFFKILIDGDKPNILQLTIVKSVYFLLDRSRVGIIFHLAKAKSVWVVTWLESIFTVKTRDIVGINWSIIYRFDVTFVDNL